MEQIQVLHIFVPSQTHILKKAGAPKGRLLAAKQADRNGVVQKGGMATVFARNAHFKIKYHSGVDRSEDRIPEDLAALFGSVDTAQTALSFRLHRPVLA